MSAINLNCTEITVEYSVEAGSRRRGCTECSLRAVSDNKFTIQHRFLRILLKRMSLIFFICLYALQFRPKEMKEALQLQRINRTTV